MNVMHEVIGLDYDLVIHGEEKQHCTAWLGYHG